MGTPLSEVSQGHRAAPVGLSPRGAGQAWLWGVMEAPGRLASILPSPASLWPLEQVSGELCKCCGVWKAHWSQVAKSSPSSSSNTESHELSHSKLTFPAPPDASPPTRHSQDAGPAAAATETQQEVVWQQVSPLDPGQLQQVGMGTEMGIGVGMGQPWAAGPWRGHALAKMGIVPRQGVGGNGGGMAAWPHSTSR